MGSPASAPDTALHRAGALKQPSAFLLDIDGTLVVTDDIYFNVFKELLRPYGYDVDLPWYLANVHGRVDKDVFAKLLPDLQSDADRQKVADRKDELFREQAARLGTPMIGGLPEALAMAKQRGVRCIAVTNAPRAAAEVILTTLKRDVEAADVIEDLVIGAECERAKPSPDPYLTAMKRLGLTAEQCIVFEDSPSGTKSGAAAGCAVVGVRSTLGDEALRSHGAAISVADWHDYIAQVAWA